MAKKSSHSIPDLPEAQGNAGVPETYRDYFLQYASYVITDRAIPDVADGLKPVQRRILHSLWENEDGRYNKVANIVGHTMKYHPHGDASINAALVSMGQKSLLIDTQGNWGDPVTNDPPAAARYIEARLTPFAKEVAFAPHLTAYKRSYDGRNQEPILLPVRFPLLLAMGTDGIAVGLATRILPHNFVELLEACKACLRGDPFQLFPDFPTGGSADVGNYQDGASGSRVKVRARFEPGPGKALIIREIPFSTNTESLIDSILSASEKGKIKVAKVEDNSAAAVEIVITFQRGVDMDKAADALYAFTDCETTLSSNCMVIREGHPRAMTVTEMLTENAEQARSLLRLDLEIQRERLEVQWHHKSLVQIFVENRIYLRIEKCLTWEDVLNEIGAGLAPFGKRLRREVTRDDLIMLTEVKIRRISAWDSEKAREELEKIDQELDRVAKHLRNVTGYAIDYFDSLLQKYGKGRERRTELTTFDTVQAAAVVERTEKLYVDRSAGFVGTDLKGSEEIEPCSTLDDILVIREEGGLTVVKVAAKRYVGENILHAQVFAPESRDQIFNLVYEDLSSGFVYAKRFTVGGVTRDKRYELGKKENKTKILFVSTDPDCRVHIKLRKKPRIKIDIYLDFNEQLVKGRQARGVIASRNSALWAKPITDRVFENRTGAEPASGDDSASRDDAGPQGDTGPHPPASADSPPLTNGKDQKRLF